MLKFVATVRQWWADGKKRTVPRASFEVTCSCGWVARGQRQPAHQLISCGSCGRKIFVLPVSPLPAVAPSTDKPAAAGPSAPARAGLRLALVAAGLVLAAAVVVSIIFFGRRGDTAARDGGPEAVAQHLKAGQDALSRGKFRTAVDELQAARELRDRYPQALGATDRRRLDQLHSEAALMTDLISESLEDILREASELEGLGKQEWQSAFRERYRGKAVVLDTEVGRDGSGGYSLGWHVFVGGVRARVELADLQLLRVLPLERPRRLLFGARLASAGLEAGGAWVVRFEPDSGVLITDIGVATACRLGQAPDAVLLDVLRRQQGWAAELP
ncbi:MAG TPA: hypothetical protein VG013_21090 [Gemmataceae bacterium]|nr:hypothetical protein [Gemmataceae bacterium]